MFDNPEAREARIKSGIRIARYLMEQNDHRPSGASREREGHYMIVCFNCSDEAVIDGNGDRAGIALARKCRNPRIPS